MAFCTALSPCQKGVLTTAVVIGSLALVVTAVAIGAIFIPAVFPAAFAAVATYVAFGTAPCVLVATICAIALACLSPRSPSAPKADQTTTAEPLKCSKEAIKAAIQTELGNLANYPQVISFEYWADGKLQIEVSRSEKDPTTIDECLEQLDSEAAYAYTWHILVKDNNGSYHSLVAACSLARNNGDLFYNAAKDMMHTGIEIRKTKVNQLFKHHFSECGPKMDKVSDT